MTDAFAGFDHPLPRPFDPARAERTLAALAAEGFTPPPRARAVFAATFGNSPFLARLALREPATLAEIVDAGPHAALERAQAVLRAAEHAEDDVAAMTILRRAKRQVALIVALADVAGLWDVGAVTRALSLFADAAIGAALRFLLRQAAARAFMDVGDLARLEAETGLIVLAMGKYGAYELNYSSDVDLIVFYDTQRFPFVKKDDPRAAAVDIVKGLVKLLAETTADGYVFRVDLRLRPDAGATQVAISTGAAEDYYESMGQNWERAALIKARACAGDQTAAARFLKAIEPFVWRRNLDFAAIEDIHSIKRQIHAHGGHGAIAIAGHNVKLGRGGIREIEFFAQTQQLILGGRNPGLRPRGTLEALRALCARGLVAPDVAEDLTEAYTFLRLLEHRLQMIEDEQTHTLPKSQEGLAHVACFAGFADIATFGAALTRRLETVQAHYARLFEREAPLSAAKGSLVFTGVEDDPETIETLSNLGFKDPSHVAGAIRGWHHGRIRATRSARARERLTKLVPPLLDAFAATADPDIAFAQFDRMLSRLPAGVQLFSLFLANPQLLDLVATIAGSAPRLADTMARAPATLDALLDRDFLAMLPLRGELDRSLRQTFQMARGFEGALDGARRFAREQIFRVGVQLIEGKAKSTVAGTAFANVAEAIVAGLLDVVQDELALTAGRVKDGAFVVIAMGKLGGREMTAGSDLDLIFVYDAPPDAEFSDGPKPLPVSTYYARLAQRFISALTAPTGEGVLYEVDMRLRPSGNKGPVAVSLETFTRYQASEAWTWERLALTRARVVAGPAALANTVTEVIRTALSNGARGDVAKDARAMREKLAAQFPGKNRWDLKFAPGGLVDIEFIAQALQLQCAADAPDVLRTNTIEALETLAKAGALDAPDAKTLINAAKLQQSLTQILRIAIDGTLDPDVASPGLKSLLIRAGGANNFALLEGELIRAQAEARAIFERVLPIAPILTG
ncbi:MAG TPA: bifunctional [glutamine synthetase] adenylyltransferase/[glutamine synthetase]-adenylyl-L-tyrosine phosphorylase [Rhizomicrobium sp.]|nr:bifunctional [glutamine synthetase] adenylyltransferase/[glutamine synthetase]-adenylyl-L-tyrosine phosphorylase [Rhizomicrobium sp.]